MYCCINGVFCKLHHKSAMKVADNHIHKPSMNIINFKKVADNHNYSQLIIIFTTDNDIHKFYQLKASKMIFITKINCDLVHGALDINVKLTSYAHTYTHTHTHTYTHTHTPAALALHRHGEFHSVVDSLHL